VGLNEFIKSGFNKTDENQSLYPNLFRLYSQMLPIMVKIGNIKMGMGIK
jgi:hypothetical protein